jgi:hypothetical protein
MSQRRGLDSGEAVDGRNQAPMDMVMELVTAVTSIATESTGEETLELIASNENQS